MFTREFKADVHDMLVWLDKNVRKSMQDTPFDVYIATPLKNMYVTMRRQH